MTFPETGRRWTLCATILLAASLIAGSAMARPPGPSHRGGPPDGGAGRLEGLIDELGLDEETLEAVDQEIDASRVRGRELRRERRDAHQQLRGLLEADEPDEAAIYAQVDVISALEADAQKNRLGTLFRVRAMLPEDARAQLIDLMEKRRARGPRHGASGPPRCDRG